MMTTDLAVALRKDGYKAAWFAIAILAALPLRAQTPPTDVLLDQIAGLVDRGKVNVQVDLQAGRAAITPEWTLEVAGTPQASLAIEADQGRVRRVDIAVTGGELLIEGRGLRPQLSIEGFRFEEGKGITEARFRGRGIWRPVIGLFRTLAGPALRHLEIPTDIKSILRGDLFTSKKSSSGSTDSFLGLVREVHINNTEFVAFAGYPLGIGETIDLRTAAHPSSGTALRAAIDKATFRPARDGQPAQFEADGRIDGEIENGSVAFVGSRCTFSHGELKEGAFHASSSKDGKPETSFSATALTLDLTSGEFRWPGGPKIGVDAPSHFAVRSLHVRPDGRYSGIVDAALFGKVGAIERAGTIVSARDIELRTHGATIADGKATGDVTVAFQYRLDHKLVVRYPVQELGERQVPLELQGSFAADFHFKDAGGDEGEVTGAYQFTMPWAPVEKAAFEVLRARWRKDIAPAIREVDFVIEPKRFGPCGRDCFLLDVVLTAEKPKKKGFLFQQICNAEGKAALVVDTPSRSLRLSNLQVEPRCEGVFGMLVDFAAPFLMKSYSDVTLLQMPADLPFTIESVGTGTDSISIGGKIAFAMK
ncbi:MAG: hypothetical protein QOK37_1555 [Thermoanaerobaculia bacterium]|jgi:hypothetical protein|nr:hypothetical protein [Thermoanaerobaculia bacterium]